jgi:hypothetical protein
VPSDELAFREFLKRSLYDEWPIPLWPQSWDLKVSLQMGPVEKIESAPLLVIVAAGFAVLAHRTVAVLPMLDKSAVEFVEFGREPNAV